MLTVTCIGADLNRTRHYPMAWPIHTYAESPTGDRPKPHHLAADIQMPTGKK
jgi:hypothetical protein